MKGLQSEQLKIPAKNKNVCIDVVMIAPLNNRLKSIISIAESANHINYNKKLFGAVTCPNPSQLWLLYARENQGNSLL